MQYGYEQFEGDHAWIQWILPTKERSAFNVECPLLTDEDIVLFKSDPVLIENYMYAIYRAMDFFGMTVFRGEAVWQEAGNHKNPKWWLEHFNHNFLRMTRLLLSLRYMGYDRLCRSIFTLLSEYEESHQNSVQQYWGPAAYGPIP
jgi:hypothetical protein